LFQRKREAKEINALHMDDAMDEDEVKESDTGAAALAPPPSGARQRVLRRAKSITSQTMPDFLNWFIHEYQLAASSKRNSNIQNALERHSSKLSNLPNSSTLLDSLRLTLTSA
jgi:glutamine synthetase adenylyltransferase